MAKAHLSLPDGTSVKIEGTPAEIAEALEHLRSKQSPAGSSRKHTIAGQRVKAGRVQVTDLIVNLIDGGFFKKPKDLASVKAALEEMGHHYPVTTLSPAMLRQVRKRNLRRLKQDNRWMYTG
jgi:hypothetical protein